MMTESENLALEYVLGTLREQERAQFIARLRTEPELMNQVSFWECLRLCGRLTTQSGFGTLFRVNPWD